MICSKNLRFLNKCASLFVVNRHQRFKIHHVENGSMTPATK